MRVGFRPHHLAASPVVTGHPCLCRAVADADDQSPTLAGPRFNSRLEIDVDADCDGLVDASSRSRAGVRLLKHPSLKSGDLPGGVLVALLEVYLSWRLQQQEDEAAAGHVADGGTPAPAPLLDMTARSTRRLQPGDVTPAAAAAAAADQSAGVSDGGTSERVRPRGSGTPSPAAVACDADGARGVPPTGPRTDDSAVRATTDAIIPSVLKALLELCDEIGAAALKNTNQALRCVLVR